MNKAAGINIYYKVYLNDPIAESAAERLKKHVQIVDNFNHPEELDAIIVRQQYCRREVIERACKCKLIQQHGTGLDRIDLNAAAEKGIPVKNTPGVNARSVAEYAVAMMLALSRKVNVIHQKTSQGNLPAFGMSETVGFEMSGKKLGLVGSGHIARDVAQIASDGFHMKVYCYNPHRTDQELMDLGFIPVQTIEELLRTCDYVSLHCTINSEAYHIINADSLQHCNPNLILVNTARGGLIDEFALFDALKCKKLRAAGLDVFEEEPPDPNHPLFSLDQFLAGMHVGGSTYEALERNGKAVVDSVFEALGITE